MNPTPKFDRATLAIFSSKIARFVDDIERTFALFDINTPRRQCHWLAQMAHESQGFTRFEENLNYSAERLVAVFPSRFKTVAEADRYARNPEKLANHIYANRNGNGDFASGDGYNFRGRGFVHLTFRGNYRAATRGLRERNIGCPDLEVRPDAAGAPPTMLLVAGWYWSDYRDCNEHADRDDLNAITRAINGGLNGIEDRREWYDRAKAALGV